MIIIGYSDNNLLLSIFPILQVEYCQLAYLPDLDQKNSFVRSALKEWVQETVQTYDFDGSYSS